MLGDKVIARTGLFDVDGSKKFTPQAEIFGKAKLPWEQHEFAQTFKTLPPS